MQNSVWCANSQKHHSASTCIIGNDNTFIASHFSNNQIILCKVHTAIIEEVFPCMLNVISSAVQNPHALQRLSSWRQMGHFCSNIMGINRSFLSCTCFCKIFEIDTTAWYLIVWLFCNTPCNHSCQPFQGWFTIEVSISSSFLQMTPYSGNVTIGHCCLFVWATVVGICILYV